MSIPHKCPVCEGRGEIGKRLAQVGAILISAKPQRFRCHGCQATGIVWDTTFTLNPLQPWTTGDVPMIGGGSISYINGHPSDLNRQWLEGCFDTYREKCDSCGDYQLGNPGDGCKTPMTHPALVLEPLTGFQEINDGVAKCRECGEPYYMEAPRSCSNHRQHGVTENARPCEDCTGPLNKEPNLGCELPGEHSRLSRGV